MARQGNLWEVPAGDSRTYQVTIMGGSGSALTDQYTGAEPLSANVWQGANQANYPGAISPAWLSPADGTTTAVVSGPVTATMPPGYYRVRLEVAYLGVTSPYYGGWLNILPVPGSAPVPPTYGSFSDLTDRAGDWLPRLQQATGETDFLFERGRARSRLDGIIVNRSRVYAYTFDLNYATIYGMFPWGPVESPDYVIQGYLAANDLIVTDQTVDIVSYGALARICEKRISFDENGEDFAARAACYYRKESQAISGYRCQIDTNADGRADIAFNLGVFQFR